MGTPLLGVRVFFLGFLGRSLEAYSRLVVKKGVLDSEVSLSLSGQGWVRGHTVWVRLQAKQIMAVTWLLPQSSCVCVSHFSLLFISVAGGDFPIFSLC